MKVRTRDGGPRVITLGLVLHADVVATPPARTLVEDAWCHVDEAGVVRVLAHTERWIEAWGADNGWRNVARADHSGNVTGLHGAVFARWKSAPAGDWRAEMGVVGIDGVTVWTQDLRHLSNTSTEVSVWWGDPPSFAVKYHTSRWVSVGRSGGDTWRAKAHADPAVVRFSRDGAHLLLGGNGAVAIAEVGVEEVKVIDGSSEQRASAFSADERAVVYAAPAGDRARLAKWEIASGERAWLTEPLTARDDTWGVQALAYVPAYEVWLGALDDAVVAVRDRDGRKVAWDAPRAMPAWPWTGYDQLADWFRAPAVVTSCGGAHVVVATFGGAIEVWELSRGCVRRAHGASPTGGASSPRRGPSEGSVRTCTTGAGCVTVGGLPGSSRGRLGRALSRGLGGLEIAARIPTRR